MAEPKKLFIAATKQNEGKTTLSLGLLSALNELCPPVGFMKPVGQRYVKVDGVRVDEDVALMRSIFNPESGLADMSPVTVGRTFTRDYIRNPNLPELEARVLEAMARVAEGKRSVVIEGTGHAGVGSVFDLSNAHVAKLLGAKVILVTSGGIGRPIDEVMLNRSLFREHGVDLLGVVLNKVLPHKLDEIAAVVDEGLGRLGIDLLGVLPFEEVLANPTMQQVLDELHGTLLHGEDCLPNEIQNVIVGAMTAHRAIEYIHRRCLLIAPGDRDDVILAGMSRAAVGEDEQHSVAGMLLTGGITPHRNTMELLRRTQIPVILVDADSYTTASAVKDIKIKIQPLDAQKIAAAQELVRKHVNVGKILACL